MINIENHQILHLKIILKKGPGEINSIYCESINMLSKKYFISFTKKLKKVLIDTVGDPALSTTPNRTLSFSFTIFITLEVSRGEV